MRSAILIVLFVAPAAAHGLWADSPPLIEDFIVTDVGDREIYPRIIGDRFVSEVPTGTGDNPYLGGRDVIAMDVSGQTLWRQTIIPNGAPYMDTSVHFQFGGTDPIIVKDTYSRLWALDATTGSILWHHNVDGDPRQYMVHGTPPVVVGSTVILAEDKDDRTSQSILELRGRSLADGSLLWQHDHALQFRDTLNGSIYAAGGNMLQRIDAATGELLIDQRFPNGGWAEHLAIHEGKVLTKFVSNREAGERYERKVGYDVWSLDLVHEGGVETPWHLPSDRWSAREMVLHDDRLVAFMDNRLAAFDVADMSEAWSISPDGLDGGPWVHDGQILYTTMRNDHQQEQSLWAVNPDGNSLGGPLPIGSPMWQGVQEIADHHVTFGRAQVAPDYRWSQGFYVFGEDHTPPTIQESLWVHEQSHENRIVWQAMVDWNPGSYLLEAAASAEGPWSLLATTHHADYESGGYLDPATSHPVDADYQFYRVTPRDLAGNVGEPTHVVDTESGDHQTDPHDPRPKEPSPSPPSGTPTDTSTYSPRPMQVENQVEVIFEPEPVVAGGSMTVLVDVTQDTAPPDEARLVLEGAGTAIFVDLTIQPFDDAGYTVWRGYGESTVSAPAAGEYLFNTRLEAERDGARSPDEGGDARVQLIVEESSPSGIKIDEIGLSHPDADEGDTVTAYVEVSSEGGPRSGVATLYMSGHAVAKTSVSLNGEPQLLEMPFVYDGVSDTVTVTIETASGQTSRTARLNNGPSLVLSVGLLNLGNIEAGEKRTIPVSVTAYNGDVTDVQLRVLEHAGLKVEAMTPTTRVPEGMTIKFFLQIEAGELGENLTAENQRMVLQAVGSNAQSNVETVNILQHERGFLGIPALGPGGVAAALATAGVLTTGFRRRD